MAGAPETGMLTCACSTPAARFQVNINGFLQRQPNKKLQFTVGHEVRAPRQWERVKTGCWGPDYFPNEWWTPLTESSLSPGPV